MTSLLDTVNRTLEAEEPVLYSALSGLGRRLAFPRDIPFQAAEARGKRYNATIGQITDGEGRILALPSVARALAGLDEAERDRAIRYSPVEGIGELRDAWRRWQRRDVEEEALSSRPVVTVGLTHGLSLVADLFLEPGRCLAVPAPFWGNYRQTFVVRTGAELVTAPAYRDGAYNCTAIEEALDGSATVEPAVAILNLPSNPGGYSLTAMERPRVLESLKRAAERRPLVVVCDDAYAGLVYLPEVPGRSLFWDLVDVHPNLIPVKVDGGTKEFNLFGARVGFLTFALDPDGPAAEAIDSKLKCLIRAAVGSPVAPAQTLLARALATPEIADEVEAVRRTLAERFRVLAARLARVDAGLLRALPFNSGCFSLVELAGDTRGRAEAVRRTLLDRHDAGVIASGDGFLRIAFCSVEAADLERLVDRLELAAREVVAESS